MEPSPGAALEVIETDLLLELLVVAFDAPSQLGEAHERLDRSGRGEVRQPELGHVFAVEPVAEEPLFGGRSLAVVMVGGEAHSKRKEPRRLSSPRALAPCHLLVGGPGDVFHEVADRDRPVVVIDVLGRRLASLARLARWRTWITPRRPHEMGPVDAQHVRQLAVGESVPELETVA